MKPQRQPDFVLPNPPSVIVVPFGTKSLKIALGAGYGQQTIEGWIDGDGENIDVQAWRGEQPIDARIIEILPQALNQVMCLHFERGASLPNSTIELLPT